MPLRVPELRIAVVGSGAVGCYYGGKLAAAGRDVSFLMRSDFDHVRRLGLAIESNKEGKTHLGKVQCYTDTGSIGPCDLVIVALKATSNDCLEDLIPPLLGANTALLTLQNGLGNEEFLADRFGGDRVMGGLCYVCLNRIGPGKVKHLAGGRIGLGEFGGLPLPRTHDVALMFKDAGVPCAVTGSLAGEQWRKLVWNVPFNGLAIAAGGVDTAAIVADESLTYLVRALMREVIGVARALGHELPTSLIEDQIKLTKSMGAYRPSSLIDYLEDRPVEVEAIWGEPVRQGFNAGAEIGRLEMLYRLIKAATAERK
jgi:2-dehydropantoate 2-reductase